MRIQLISDIHTEFHHKYFPVGGWIKKLPNDCDVLVVAGDGSNSTNLVNTINWLCKRFPRVLYVAGNHEYWKGDKSKVESIFLSAQDSFKNFTWLENKVVEIAGVRFLGATMWFRKTLLTKSMGWDWADFNRIGDKDPAKWIYQANTDTLNFFEREMKEGDVVITHHLPSNMSVDPRYAYDQSNCFFVCACDELIQRKNPKLWLHGHTHSSHDYVLPMSVTRVVCNPFGYMNREENRNFNPGLILDV